MKKADAIGRRAELRMLMHVVSGIAAVGVVTAYRSRAHTTTEVWTGYILYGTAMLYTCLGVNLIKESIPALRGVTGDIRDERMIMAVARRDATRDGVILAAIAGSVLLATPWRVDAGSAIGALFVVGLLDFFIRQLVERRRRTRVRAARRGGAGQASMR